MQTTQKARRYRVAMANGFGIDLSEEYATAADADRASDEIKGGHHWVEVFNEKDGQWWLLHYDNAIFQDSGCDVLIDIDGTGRWELFSTCANQHDARNMAKHYQEQHNPRH